MQYPIGGGCRLAFSTLCFMLLLSRALATFCNDPGIPANGKRTIQSFRLGGQVSYYCKSGYQLVGDKQRICLYTRSGGLAWSGSLPRCNKIISCPVPEVSRNSHVDWTGLSVGSSATYTCNSGYTLYGNRVRTCKDSGVWSDRVPECRRPTPECEDPPELPNGIYRIIFSSGRKYAWYHCKTGYQMVGYNYRYCQTDGSWSGRPPTCRRITPPQCGDPGDIQNGGKSVHSFSIGGFVTYYCNSGYSLTGNSRRECVSDGASGAVWSGTSPICKPDRVVEPVCRDPGTPSNGNRVITSTDIGGIVTYTCRSGYYLIGDSERTCQRSSSTSASWSGSLPRCEEIQCGDPGTPANGDRTISSQAIGGTVRYTCNSGYYLVGDSERTCRSSGSSSAAWSGSLPRCDPLECSDPGTPSNGGRNLGGRRVGDRVSYSCNSGYSLVGDSERTCQSSGSTSAAWSGSLPRCEIALCSDPGTPLNGGRNLGGNSIGDQVNYFCNSGYYLVGDLQRTCQSSGSNSAAWSGSLPRCEALVCGDPGTPRNGARRISSSGIGGIVYYTCDSGYYLSGDSERTCQQSGSNRAAWSGSLATCIAIECSDPGTPLNGGRNLGGNSIGDQVNYFCNSGYSLVGDSERTCQSSGSSSAAWSGSLPRCEIALCSDPGTPLNGGRNLGGNSIGDQVNYFCNSGYYLVGDLQRTCQSSGSNSAAWSGSLPRCEALVCGDPGTPRNGARRISSSGIGGIVYYTCDSGYYLSGDSERTCQQSGSNRAAWSGSLATCIAIECSDPGTPSNGGRNLGGRRVGDRVSYFCNSGYSLVGDSERTCQSSGLSSAVWSGSLPRCEAIQCGDPGTPANGDRTISSQAIGGTVRYTCNSGYYLVGDSERTCRSSGSSSAAWSGSLPRCDPLECSDPGTPSNGGRNLGGRRVGDRVSYSCNSGYSLVGDSERTCQSSGSTSAAWSGSLPRCEERVVTCGDPDSISNGGYRINGKIEGSVAEYYCNSGYNIDGGVRRVCQSNGLWSGVAPRCIQLQCQLHPGQLSRGSVSISSSGPPYSVGTLASYTCDEGYERVGDNSRTCQSDGQWSGSVPQCRLKQCSSLQAPENGFIDTSGGCCGVGSQVRFSCRSSYQLSGAAVLQCLSNAQWNNQVPSCVQVVCPNVGILQNGDISVSGIDGQVGTKLTFTCKPGYTLSGSSMITCQGDGQWSDSVPTCIAIDCGDPGSITNGQRSLTGTAFQDIATYRCDSGYELEGEARRICQSSARWSGSLPSCRPVDCGDPGTPQNGNRAFTSTTYQSSVTFTCNSGYKLEGSSSRLCQANGQWSASVPSCSLIQCGDPGTPLNGNRDLSGRSVSSVVRYTCNVGYSISGDQSRTCQSSGFWSGSLPSCSLIDCGDPGTPSNGQRNLDGTTYNSRVTYRCDSGYTLRGSQSRTCQSEGRWSNSLPECVAVRCGDPGTPNNGNRNLGGLTYRSDVTYTCNEGYELRGDASRSCQANGQWSGSLPSCTLVDCGDPGTPQNGRRQLSGTKYRDTVTYECNSGYEIDGASSRSCQANGQWSGSLASCTVVDCGDPGTPSNGQRTSFSGTRLGSRVSYECNEGYNLRGQRSRTCQSSGQWSAELAQCEIIDCGDPGTPQNGRRDLSSTTFGSSVSYSCNDGYRLEGSQSRSCRSDGRWSEGLPQCRLISCGDPGVPRNGRRQLLSSTVGSRVVFDCNDGYKLDGNRERTCQSNGQWSGSLPSCSLIDCGDPGTISNGDRSLAGTTYSSTVIYRCQSGFTLEGTNFRTCQLSGSWSGALPSCREIDCGDPGTPQNGNKNSSQTRFGSVVFYTCNSGYSLQGGSSTRRCQSNAMWSSSLPSCIISNCNDPGTPSNGQRTLDGLSIGSSVTYTCNSGYRLSGISSRLCLTSGQWTGSLPSCIQIDCGDPGTPSNGRRIGSSTNVNSEVRYECNDGYELEGNERRSCQQNGRWSGSLPRCVIGGCGDPGTPDNGQRELRGTAVSSTVSYSCNRGYRASGTQFRVCQSSGQWSGRLPQCSLISCGDPGRPQNGDRSLSNTFNFGSVATFTCNDGFDLDGSQTRVCQESGFWSNSLPSCVPSGCDDPGTPSNGRRELSNGVEVFSTVTYECNTGYELIGISTRVCLASGQWTSSLPSCQLVDCGDPGVPDNGKRTLPGTKFGSSVEYTCNDGYELKGNAQRTCGANGKWSGFLAQCVPVDCGDPGSVQNGNKELPSGTIFPSTAIFKCNFGYSLEGTATRVCQQSGQWSGSLPRCIAITCDDPGTPDNGVRVLEGLVVNSVVTYQCNSGYQIQGGSLSRVCRQSGEWTGQLPSCVEIDCGDPGTPSNGQKTVASGTTFKKIARFSCDDGFALQGVQQRECQANGQWSGSLPSCIRNDCGDPGSVTNGQRQLTSTTVGSQVTYTCNEGYRQGGSRTRVCQSSGRWSGSAAQCTVIDCGDAGTPGDGRRAGSTSTTFGSEVTYSCNDGFALRGSETRECQSSGSWSGSLPSCERVDCGDPGRVTNGDRVLGLTTFRSQVVYYCNRGYLLDSGSTRTCQADGEWSGSLPSCVVVTCGDPGTPSNGARQLTDQNFGTTVRYTCNDGYKLDGSRTRSCQADGEWSGEIPECTIIDCGFPGEPEDGSVDASETTFRSIARYSCDDGYELEGSSTRQCGSNSLWSGSVPTCAPVDCGDPGEPENGESVVFETTFKSVVRYRCFRGYELTGNELRACQSSGQWSGSLPQCEPEDCGDPGTPSNGDVSLSASTKLGSIATYTCDTGYNLVGSSKRTCQAEGRWSGELPSCEVVDCGDPGTPSRGSRSPSTVVTILNSDVTYSCDEGYELIGSKERTCQVNGRWSGSLPNCQIVDCDDPGSPSNGDRRLVSTTFRSQVQYECRRGYRLEGASERTCQSNGQWSGNLPSCVLIDCGDPGEPQNGRVSLSSGTTLGSRATFVCNTGYESSSSRSRVCQSDGSWSGSVATCQLVNCGDPGTPFKGSKLGAATTFGARVRYRCDSGYVVTGLIERVCQADSSWSGSLPSCELVDCGDPGTPENGIKIGTGTTFGSEVSYRCNNGYELSGPQSRQCLSTKQWSGTLAACVIVSCGSLSAPSNGKVEFSDETFGTTATYSCNDGYRLIGLRTRVCESSGEWSGEDPSCRAVDCSDPGTPRNGQRQLSTTTFGSDVSYTCNTGYTLQGATQRSCQANGRWSDRLPECEPVDCRDPGSPTNGDRVLSHTTLGADVVYICNRGYRLEGSERRTCQSSGSWSGSVPTCSLLQCEDPGTPQNGARQLSSRTVQSTVTYTCNTGYRLQGSRTRRCQDNAQWSGDLPECVLIDCGDPGSPINGGRSLPATTYQSQVTYTCNNGYQLDGEATRQCQANGKWSGFLPSCAPVDCGDPGSVTNGNRVLLSTTFTSVVLYSCNIGYRLEGDQRRTCQANGQWSNRLPSCAQIDCGDPGEPENGRKNIRGSGTSAVVTYRCDIGYRLQGDTSRVCQTSGSWSGTVPTCNIVECGDPGTPASGLKQLTRTTYNARVQYTCLDGFSLQGQQERVCQANGRWSGSLPACVPSDCGDPGAPQNGRVDVSSTSIGSTAQYVCTEGYTLRGLKSRLCQQNGDWSGDVPECVLVDCNDPGTPFKGSRSLSATTYSSEVTYQCDDGYVLQGSTRRRCQADGSWSENLPSCELVDCGDPGVPNNGFKTGASYKFGSKVTYRCNTGYELSGPEMRMCQSDGQWSGTLPSCVVVTCGDPGTPVNGVRTLQERSFGATVTYSCSEGFRLAGDRVRTCQSNGEWSGILPTCNIISCSDPGTPLNAMKIGTEYTFGSRVRYECKPGYQLDGTPEIQCQANGQWSNSLPRCVLVSCGDPGRPTHGNRELSSTTAFSMVTYSCNRGYKLTGSQKRTCLPSGNWNGSLPQCTIIDCRHPGTPSNGAIVELSSTSYGSTVTYKCNVGYILKGVNTRVCQENGVWSANLPVCEVLDCNDPGTPNNGRRILSSTTYGSTVVYECVMGYVLKGPKQRTCQADGSWSESLPTCPPVDCGDPGSPPNSVRVLPSTDLNSRVQYQCVDGYKLLGDASRTCQKSGQWSGSPPSCTPITCRDPGTPTNSRRTLQGLSIGSTVTYHCNEGYQITGTLTRSCQSNGEWTGTLPTCQIIDCGDPGTPDNGNERKNATTYRSSVWYTCIDGYEIQGERHRTCQSNGKWSGSLPLCSPVNCGEPGEPRGGYGAYDSTTLNSVVLYACERGHNLVGSERRTCLNTGLWSGSLPECRIVDCGQPGSPVNGQVSVSVTILNSVATYSCDVGYILNGIQRRVCQFDGTWSGNLPSCQKVDCGDPGEVENSVKSLADTLYGSTVTYTCNSGYVISGPATRRCLADGSWSEYKPVCKIIRCRDPGVPSNGQRELLDTIVGSLVRYSCTKGYKLEGDSQRQCQNDGSWSGSLPVCRIVDCGDPGTPRYGARSTLSHTTYSATVTYSCKTGYLLSGDLERICLDNGEWSGTLPTCRPVDCGTPGSPDNGRAIYTNTSYLSVVRYECREGYNLAGRDVRQCRVDGSWDHVVPRCQKIAAVNCGDPGRPNNGDSSYSSTTENSVVIHTCQSGYTLVGDSRRLCRADGRWSGQLPVCRAPNCGPPEQAANGLVSYTSTSVGASATYSCNHGYQLVGSSHRVCQSSGQWSGTTPTCQFIRVVRCSDPGTPSNAVRALTGLNIGDTATYSCRVGYVLVGSRVLQCQSNGQWSPSLPYCQVEATPPPPPRNCEVPEAPQNGRVVYTSLSVGSFATYVCDPGYQQAGDRSRICQSNLQWSGSIPQCSRNACNDPGTPANGRRSGTDFSVGASVIYSCSSGFSLVGTSTLICLSNGVWSSSAPICQKNLPSRFCTDPGVPENGRRIIISNDVVGSIIYFECADGFQLQGSSRRVCQSDGSYDGQQPRCVLISDTCVGNNVPVFDGCGRHCICSSGKLTNCRRVRRDFLSLSAEEKQRYLDTVFTVTTDPYYKPRYDALVEKYNEFQNTAAFGFEPETSQFLPWNRFFLIEYENLLRSVDCRITIPYWDWTIAPNTPYNTKYFDDTLGFGRQIRSSDKCVISGPFRADHWTKSPASGGGCLQREYQITKTFPTRSLLQNDVMPLTSDNFNTFHTLLHILIHNNIRCFVWGCSSGSVDPQSDPIYLLHLSRVDSVFDVWQRSGGGRAAVRYSTDATTLLCTTLPVKAYSSNEELPDGIAVEYGPVYHVNPIAAQSQGEEGSGRRRRSMKLNSISKDASLRRNKES